MSVDIGVLLQGVDWSASVAAFIAQKDFVSSLQVGCHHVAVFAHELSFQYYDNHALAFLQEMKASISYVPVCIALGLPKPAASSMRAAVESALYFTYFKDHPVELGTLTSNKKYYLTKKKILDHHIQHTPGFGTSSVETGFTDKLSNWYGEISAIVHGQIPGVWTSRSVEDLAFDPISCAEALRSFEQAVSIIRYLFLLTTPIEIWEGINPLGRKLFMKTVAQAHKEHLNLALV